MSRRSQYSKRREIDVFSLFQILRRRTEQTWRNHVGMDGLDVRLLELMVCLSERDGVNQKHLSDELNEPEYATSRSIDKLVEKGFAERQPDPGSRRSTLVFLTEKGRSNASQLLELIEHVDNHLMKELSIKERETLIRILQETLGSPQS